MKFLSANLFGQYVLPFLFYQSHCWDVSNLSGKLGISCYVCGWNYQFNGDEIAINEDVPRVRTCTDIAPPINSTTTADGGNYTLLDIGTATQNYMSYQLKLFSEFISDQETVMGYTCPPGFRFCKAELMLINGVFTSVSRLCAFTCAAKEFCEFSGYGIHQTKCESCCDSDWCNRWSTRKFYAGQIYTNQSVYYDKCSRWYNDPQVPEGEKEVVQDDTAPCH